MSDAERKKITGRAVPLPGNDVDTDRIIPARFMKCVTFDQLGQYVFYDARFNADGSAREHPFNEEKYRGASILVAGRNFGCGSSREHAPQALMRWGIRAVIAESFAEIFAGNCTALGIPAVTASRPEIENLMACVRENPAGELTLDLEEQTVEYGDFEISIRQNDQARRALLEGSWDTTGSLLAGSERIRALAVKLPYLRGFRPL